MPHPHMTKCQGLSQGIERRRDPCEPEELRGRLLEGKAGMWPGMWMRCRKWVDSCAELYSILVGNPVGAMEIDGGGMGALMRKAWKPRWRAGESC